MLLLVLLVQRNRRTTVSGSAPLPALAFGASLQTVRDATAQPVPSVVSSCIRVLRQVGMDVEGIFRVPGSQSQVDELKTGFERGVNPLSEGLPPHIMPEAVAGESLEIVSQAASVNRRTLWAGCWHMANPEWDG